MSRHVFLPGNRWLIGYLAFLSAFAPLSTDLFLPALPNMTEALHTTAAVSSLLISCFLLIFALSMVLWGPLSDKYGRKPILVAGTSLYVISSVCIALSGSIQQLIVWRCVQAVGSGAVSAMSLAIVAVRPPSTVLMMQQVRTDNGTVTALINSGGLLCGSLAMFVCAVPFWESAIVAEAALCFCIGITTLVAWQYIARRNIISG